MAVNMRGKSLTTLLDWTPEEILQILDTASDLKRKNTIKEAHPLLAGKSLAMIFQKPSLRTRVSFEVGMSQLGGSVLYLAPADIKLGERETTEDIAQVLSRYIDGIMARVFGHQIIVDLARYATVPVINGLSDFAHPCQILGDFLTIKEKLGRLAGVKIAYLGDGNNVANSLIFGSAQLGLNIAIASPPGFEPNNEVLQKVEPLFKKKGVTLQVTNEPREAVKSADVIYTDVWASMGQEAERQKRIKIFQGFQVNHDLIADGPDDFIFLHCLPAHYGEEVTDEMAKDPRSFIYDQAENRMHAQKAVLALVM
ncbi:ornithine carbamoyltransferase [candidate division CSSED10-310 bacterium]|uniref:Ornithine carbamoyltransferase n=1 Tax=candidate division CSSED10-310 bacterium TaxID=2855610 RepID=A0ABV6Z4V1_UNCC1